MATPTRQGKITQIIGPVVDLSLKIQLPAIGNAIKDSR